MFSRFSRLPFRRCLHTSSGAARSTGSLGRPTKLALGASAVAASYITWQLTDAKNQIFMDSPRTVTSTPEHSTPLKSPQRREAPSEPTSAAEPGVFVPDVPSIPDTLPDSKSDTVASEADGETSSGEAPASGGAFNPETGEINWDCPCLGGMAHGPCGPEFREAFSCFVYSEAEPKGINCVEKFQNMQNCFRAHPDVYADEIMNDDEEDATPETSASSDVPPSERPTEEKFTGDVPSTAETPKPDSTPAATTS